MKFKVTLNLAAMLILVAGAAIADDAQVRILTPQKAPRPAKGTGVQGTITAGTLPAGLQQLTCNDLTVHVGILHAGTATLTTYASSRATGTISSGQCSFHVNSRLPAGGPFDVVIVREQAKDACRLSASPSLGRVTLTRGETSTLDVQLAPVCQAD